MRKKRIIPVCCFPATVMFVDDNQTYLTNLKLQLDVSRFFPKFFSSPAAAVTFLDEYKPKSFLSKCLSRPEEKELDHRSIEINVHPILQIMNDENRFDEVALATIDFAMPGEMNGLELAKRIRKDHPEIKIMMLTSEADHQLAVKAFNDGIIDKFIRKDTENFKDVLNEAICELMYEYFVDQSTIILDSLTKDPDHPTISWLDEPKLVTIFDEMIKKEKKAEYYLAESYGSFLLLDDVAKLSLFACKDKETMRAVCEMAEDSDIPFPPGLLKELKEYKKVIYLPHGRLAAIDPKDTEKALYPATELVGNKTTYYYAYVNNPKIPDIHPEKILSYKAYRQKQAKK